MNDEWDEVRWKRECVTPRKCGSERRGAIVTREKLGQKKAFQFGFLFVCLNFLRWKNLDVEPLRVGHDEILVIYLHDSHIEETILRGD